MFLQIAFIIYITYIIIGIIVMIYHWKNIEKTYVYTPGLSPFLNGFILGVYRLAHIIMFPYYLLELKFNKELRNKINQK